MKKGFLVFLLSFCTCMNAFAVKNKYIPKKFTTVTSYNDVYPYVLNDTKTNTDARDISNATSARRAVVPRSNTARAAKKTTTPQTRRVVQRTNNNTARAAAMTQSNMRSNTSVRNNPVVRTRNVNTVTRTTTNNITATGGAVSSQRCFADYKECMENYCQREDTPYNRCYCSAKLAQIDAKYQNKIDELIQTITRLQYGNNSVSSEEIREYWNQKIGVYSNEDPWVNIDNALNIEWADMQSRVRGQNAFNTGHEYCVQHLRACYYMANNLRDAYKSEIARDCETYEKGMFHALSFFVGTRRVVSAHAIQRPLSSNRASIVCYVSVQLHINRAFRCI